MPRPLRKKPETRPLASTSVLPMQLKVGDRFTDETGEWEITDRPHTMAGGKMVRARVQRVGEPVVLSASGW